MQERSRYQQHGELPVYDMDYMRRQGMPTPPIPVYIPPTPGRQGPGNIVYQEPPAPVDWGQRGMDVLQGFRSLLGKFDPFSPGISFGRKAQNVWDKDEATAEIRADLDAGAPIPNFSAPVIGNIPGSGRFAGHLLKTFEDELKALGTVAETVTDPAMGLLTSLETLPIPVDSMVMPPDPYMPRGGGTSVNPFHSPDVEARRTALRNTINPRTNEPYGPMESAAKAYVDADIPGMERFVMESIFDPIILGGPIVGGTRKLSALGGAMRRAPSPPTTPPIRKSIGYDVNRQWAGIESPQGPSTRWTQEVGPSYNRYWREGMAVPEPPAPPAPVSRRDPFVTPERRIIRDEQGREVNQYWSEERQAFVVPERRTIIDSQGREVNQYWVDDVTVPDRPVPSPAAAAPSPADAAPSPAAAVPDKTTIEAVRAASSLENIRLGLNPFKTIDKNGNGVYRSKKHRAYEDKAISEGWNANDRSVENIKLAQEHAAQSDWYILNDVYMNRATLGDPDFEKALPQRRQTANPNAPEFQPEADFDSVTGEFTFLPSGSDVRFTPAAAAPSPADAAPSPAVAVPEISAGRQAARTIDDVEASDEMVNISPEDMDRGAQQELVRQSGDASGHDGARDVLQDDALREVVDSGGGTFDDIKKRRDALISFVKNRFSADSYMKFTGKGHDSGFSMRAIVDFRHRTRNSSKDVHEAFQYGGVDDVVTAIQLSAGPVPRAVMTFQNFMKISIEPLLGKMKGDLLGVTSKDISKILIARHYKSLMDNPKTRFNRDNLPTPVDDTGQLLDADIDVLDWERRMRESMSPSEWARVEKGVESIRDLYIRQRENLVKNGIISRENADMFAEEYPWYNPISYIEFLDVNKGASGVRNSSSPFSNFSSGLRHFSKKDAIDEAGKIHVFNAVDPLSPEVMLKQLTQNEMRIRRNTIGKMIYEAHEGRELTDESLGWLQDVTKDFQSRELVDGKYITVNDIVPYQGSTDLKRGEGYLVFYENGKRKVYGGIGKKRVDGKPQPLPSPIFDIVYGKGGLASKGNSELENWWGWMAGIKRGYLTTFNPIFMFGNGILDMFTVWVKRGVLPPGVINQIVKNYDGIVNEADNVLIDIMRTSGAFQSRTTDVNTYARNLQRRLDTENLDGLILMADDFHTSTKVKNKLDEIFDEGFLRTKIKLVGQKWSRTSQVIEQAARMEVAERTMIARLGAPEWNRLNRLSREQFIEELLHNYRGTPGKGLADHPAIREAGAASLEATVNFYRGGEWIRRINPLTYFLNPAMEGTKLPFRAIGVNLHPTIRPVRNPEPGGPLWEYGEYMKGRRRGVTGKLEDLDITRRTTTGNDLLDDLRYKHNTDTIPMMDFIRTAFTGKGLTGANGAMVRMGGILTAQATIMGWNLMWADEWGYWDIPGWIKYSGFLILLPPKRDENGEYIRDDKTGRVKPNFIVIPHRTREWSIVTAFPQFAMEKIATSFDKSSEGKASYKAFVSRLFSEASPVDNLPVLGGDPTNISTYLKPFVGLRELGEELEGKDYWRGEKIVPPDLEYRDPSDQYQPFTSPTIKTISRLLPEDSLYRSPLRAEHLVNNIFGGTGKVALSLPDWIIDTIDGIHRKNKMSEPNTPDEQAMHYRSLKTSMERKVYRASIARQGIYELEQFEDALRKPRNQMKNVFSDIPLLGALSRRYNPPYSGGLREIGERQQEALGFNIDKENHAELRTTLKRTRKTIYAAQLEDDSEISAWARRKNPSELVGISPTQWRKNRSERFGNYEFFKQQMIDMFGENTVYELSSDDQEQYYNAAFQLASKAGVIDIRLQAEVLFTAYQNIRYPEGEDPDLELVNKFYEDRKLFVDKLRSKYGDESKEFGDFENLRQSSMTETERRYDKAREIMNPYFNIGRNIRELVPGASPQQVQIWDGYQKARTRQEKDWYTEKYKGIINMFKSHRDLARRRYVMSTIDVNGQSNLDEALAFWYGDSYYSDKAVTMSARGLIDYLHSPAIYNKLPSAVR